MKSKFIKTLFAFFFVFLFTMIVNGVEDFSVNPNSFSITKELSQSGNGVITIENTGDENISISISKVNLVNGTNTISLNLDKTSINGLQNGSSENLTFSFNSGTNSGVFRGLISFENSNNASHKIEVPVVVTVNPQIATGASIAFRDYSNTLEMVLDVDDSSEKKTFYLVNDGTKIITDIEIKLDDLDGDKDEIENDDIEINGEPGDVIYKIDDEEGDGFEFHPGDEYKIKIDIDIPNSLDVDDYRGDLEVRYKAEGISYERTFVLKVIAESSEENAYIDQSTLYVKSGILEIITEAGENENDYSFEVVNDASYDISDFVVRLDGDFKEEDSGRTMSKSVLSFDPSTFDVDERDSEEIDIELDIPENQATGTYLADIELISASGKKLDEIQLKIKVTGDIFIKSLVIPENVKPGDNVDVEVVVKNKGSQVYRNIKITGYIYDIDNSNSDLIESSSNFLLEVERERKETLRFKIPDDARDGSHTLELIIDYDGSQLSEVETIEIVRPSHKVEISSSAINPITLKCDKQLFSFMKVENLGRYDEDVIVSVEIIGTGIKKTSPEFELNVNEISQKNLVLDVSRLEAGTYTVEQKASYSGLFIKEISDITVYDCIDTSVGIDIKPVEDNDSGINETSSDSKKDEQVKLFGTSFEKTTIYLGTGIVLVFLLIVISLFLL
ncbi:MAG: hypothetical protein KC550_05005 [Nanoarchaeota archaeon]|nr:hypothetical protein [Nanoarchaeota archaeon]